MNINTAVGRIRIHSGLKMLQCGAEFSGMVFGRV